MFITIINNISSHPPIIQIIGIILFILFFFLFLDLNRKIRDLFKGDNEDEIDELLSNNGITKKKKNRRIPYNKTIFREIRDNPSTEEKGDRLEQVVKHIFNNPPLSDANIAKELIDSGKIKGANSSVGDYSADVIVIDHTNLVDEYLTHINEMGQTIKTPTGNKVPRKIMIQCKAYKETTRLDSHIMKACVSAKEFYSCDLAVLFTTAELSSLTINAKDELRAFNILLFTLPDLEYLLELYEKSEELTIFNEYVQRQIFNKSLKMGKID